MKKIYKIIGLLIIVTLLIVGCSSEEPATDQTEEEQPVQTEKQERQEVVEQEDEKKVEQVKDVETGNDIRSEVLRDIMNSKRYTIKMRNPADESGEDPEATITTVVADGQMATSMDSGDGSLDIIVKDGKSYMILHESKTIIVTDISEEDETEPELTEFISSDLEYVGKGKDIFLGNKRDYEEYKMDLDTVRYYLDGKELDGMEISIDMSDLITEEDASVEKSNLIIDVVSFEKEADMSVFELPEDYDYQVLGE